MLSVSVAGFGIVNFPDSMSEEEVRQALDRMRREGQFGHAGAGAGAQPAQAARPARPALPASPPTAPADPRERKREELARIAREGDVGRVDLPEDPWTSIADRLPAPVVPIARGLAGPLVDVPLPVLRRGADAAAGWTVGLAEHAGLVDEGTRQEMQANLEAEREASLLHGNADQRALALAGGELGGGAAGALVPGLSLGRAAGLVRSASPIVRGLAAGGVAAAEGALQTYGDTAGSPEGVMTPVEFPGGIKVPAIALGAGLGAASGLAGVTGGLRKAADFDAAGAATRTISPVDAATPSPATQARIDTARQALDTDPALRELEATSQATASRTILDQYDLARQQLDAEIDSALAANAAAAQRNPVAVKVAAPEEAQAFREQRYRAFDNEWNPIIRDSATTIDDATLHDLADRTEVPASAVQAPPMRRRFSPSEAGAVGPLGPPKPGSSASGGIGGGPSNPPELTVQRPRWALSAEDGLARLGQFAEENKGATLSPDDLPFKLSRLPLIRWERTENALNPRREGGQFWLIGDSLEYNRPASDPGAAMDPSFDVGGHLPQTATFEPRNPLIVSRPAFGTRAQIRRVPVGVVEGEFFKQAQDAGHDAVVMVYRNPQAFGQEATAVEVVTFPGAKIGPRQISAASVRDMMHDGVAPEVIESLRPGPESADLLALYRRVYDDPDNALPADRETWAGFMESHKAEKRVSDSVGRAAGFKHWPKRGAREPDAGAGGTGSGGSGTGVGPGGRFSSGESGAIGPLGRPKAATPQTPAERVIRYGDVPREPLRDRLRKAGDRLIDQLSDKEDAPVRLLRRAELPDAARQIERYIGRARGASRIARLALLKGVRRFDPVTGNTTRVHDSLNAVIGGLDDVAERDLNNYMAARHHMELVARRDRAQLEYDMARAARLNDLRQTRRADADSLRRMAGDVRSARARELIVARRAARAQGQGEARLDVSRTIGTRALATNDRSLDRLAGRQGEAAGRAMGRQAAAAALAPGAADRSRYSINAARRVAMGIRDQATRLYREHQRVDPHPDVRLDIDDEGTAIARQIIDDIEQRYGVTVDPATGTRRVNQLDDIADGVRSWSTAAVIDQLDSVGYFRPGQRDALLAAGQQYAPFFRLLDEVAADPQFVSGGTSSSPIKRISGGLSPKLPIAPPLESFIAQHQRVAVWVERQRINNLLGDYAEAHPDTVGAEIRQVAPGTDSRSYTAGTFTVFRDGQRIQYSGPDDLIRAVSHMAPEQANVFLQAGIAAARLLRSGATLTLDFAVRNFLRDQFSASAYGSEFRYRPTDFFAGLWAQTRFASPELRTFVDDWEAAGGALSDYISIERPDIQYDVRSVRNTTTRQQLLTDWHAEQNKIVKYVLYPVLKPMEAASSRVEQATRIGAYRRAKLGGASDLEGGFYSRNITLDFGRSGTLGQRWNSVEAFANASLQDVARFSRAMRERPISTTMQAAAYITLPALATWAAYKDDPQYQALPEWERAAFLHVHKLDDGRWVRIPRPQGLLNLTYGYGIVKMLDAARGRLDEPVNELLAVLFNETPLRFSPIQPDPTMGGSTRGSFEAIPSALQPAMEAAAGEGGWSSFRQSPIVPAGMQDSLLPEDRAGDTTTTTARLIGRKMGVAPLKVDSLIRGYGAGLSYSLVQGVEKLTGVGNDLPPLPSTAKEIPGVGGLISGPSYGFATQPVQDFYALESQATAAAGSLRQAAEQGRVFDYQRILREHPEWQLADQLAKSRRELKELRDYRRDIRTNKSLTPEMRFDMLLKVDQAVTQIAAGQMHQASDFLRAYRERNP